MASTTVMYGRKYQKGLNAITTLAMIGFHAGAISACFFVDAGAILAALISHCIAGMLGIGMTYHRLLTHRVTRPTNGSETS
jgi:stearoyl-CoA desaturase (delta-9 desaturase)